LGKKNKEKNDQDIDLHYYWNYANYSINLMDSKRCLQF